MSIPSIVPKIKLNNGVEMPALGFGVFQVPDLKECEKVVLEALKKGYRLLDTAAHYYNEKAVGRAIKKSGIPRDQIFVTSKLWVQDFGYENAKKGFQTALDNLGLDYLDLYLIHHGFGDYYGAWRALEELYEEGKIRAIGVSNFEGDKLVDLIMHNRIKPAVDQIEFNPLFQRKNTLAVMKEYDVQPECWGPFVEGKFDIFNNETLVSIAKKYNKTTAQVILRWDVQKGVITIPKSVHKERIEENFEIWDFELSQDDMDAIAKLDRGKSQIIDFHDIKIVKYLGGDKIHD